LSIVSDTFDLWKLITEYLPANKEAIMARDGKLVIRPDSGDPVDIICGNNWKSTKGSPSRKITPEEQSRFDSMDKGVIELLWDIFGGTINEQGYKVLDPHIGCIYGDSITPERQLQIYERLAAKGFAATNIVLGVGSYTYQYTTRDWASMAAKGSWFETLEVSKYHEDDISYGEPAEHVRKEYNIYKDPVTDDGMKKSLKGLLAVHKRMDDLSIWCKQECTHEEESQGLLQVIYEDGKFFNQTSLTEIRERLK
jgi:nicotinamide phosphoribosyltransferase